MTRSILTFLLLFSTSLSLAGDPTIVGEPSLRVKANTPPFVLLTVTDAPENSVLTWLGDIGAGNVAIETKGGLAVATVPGSHTFRCRLQTPSDGLDPIVEVEVTVLVEKSDGTIPPPPPPPIVLDFAAKLSAAVRKVATAETLGGFENVAKAYEGIADQIKAGSPLMTTPEAVRGTTALMATFASPDWAAIDTEVVQPHLATLGLTTAAQFEGPWRDIAKAVKAGLVDLPPPVVIVDPTPLPVAGLHVLIVWDKDQKDSLPASQVGIFSSTALVDWFNANNVQWRQFYQDVDQSLLEPKWKAALALPRASTPWLIVSDGKTKSHQGPLPKSEPELISILEQHK